MSDVGYRTGQWAHLAGGRTQTCLTHCFKILHTHFCIHVSNSQWLLMPNAPARRSRESLNMDCIREGHVLGKDFSHVSFTASDVRTQT